MKKGRTDKIANKMTIIFTSPIFGPIHFHSFGISLGINLLPNDGKVCSFDCIYCECGFKAEHKFIPTREEVHTALKEKLKDMQANGLPDVLTFAGRSLNNLCIKDTKQLSIF